MTLEALRKNYLAQQSRLFIFSDGPKDESSAEGVKRVREYISSVRGGFASVEIVERERNYGSGRSVSAGITQVLNDYDRIIVIEDDILTSPYFLTYMNDALELYKNEDKVGVVDAYLRPMDAQIELPQTFFVPIPETWGWGTWRRAWRDFEFDAAKLLAQIESRGLSDEFNMGLKSQFYTNLLKAQINGKVDAWDIQWYASNFLHGRLALQPNKTFVVNIGLDGSGTHCGTREYSLYNGELAESYKPAERLAVEVKKSVYEVVQSALSKILPPKPPLPVRAIRKIWRIIQGV